MPTPPNKPRDPSTGDAPEANRTPGPATKLPSTPGPAPGRDAGARIGPLPAPRPVDAPNGHRYTAGDELAGCDECDVSFTAPDDVDASPDKDDPDTDEHKDTDEGTDGNPVLA